MEKKRCIPVRLLSNKKNDRQIIFVPSGSLGVITAAFRTEFTESEIFELSKETYLRVLFGKKQQYVQVDNLKFINVIDELIFKL